MTSASPRPRAHRLGRLFALATLALAFGRPAAAQELNCRVTVDFTRVQGNEYEFLRELGPEIERYLNGRTWTEDAFGERERIACSFALAFTSAQGLSRFNAQLVVQSSRPVWGTTQTTNLLLVNDTDWEFTYNRGQGLLYNASRYDSFVSVLDYYALLILGYDYDSFEELGGQPYFERARAISEVARGASGPGWYVTGDDYSRGNLVAQLLDTRFTPLRRAYFTYHLGVLDRFTTAHEEAWEEAVAVVATLGTLYDELNQRRHATDLFFDTKYGELAQVLADAPRRGEAYEVLVEADPQHQAAYDALVN